MAKVLVDNIWQKVQNKGLHLVCFGCRCSVHRKENCLQVLKESSPEASTTVNTLITVARVEVEEDRQDFGSWMLVGQRSRRSKNGPGLNVANGNTLSHPQMISNVTLVAQMQTID